MNVFLFPGQGAQFAGMGKALLAQHSELQALAQKADEILGFSLSEIMAEGSEEDLRQTRVTQPAIFVHSMLCAQLLNRPVQVTDIAAGHSLGEFSALCFAGALSFEEALQLVYRRALAMQEACEAQAGTMAAVMTNDNSLVEQVCAGIEGVVPANYNNPGQLVISGTLEGVAQASAALKEQGARAIPLKVGGAFHSPLMQPAQNALQAAIEKAQFSAPKCGICQNVTARPTLDVDQIRENLIAQLTAPVRWQQSMEFILSQGAGEFIEVGGKGGILLGMLKKIDRQAQGFSFDESQILNLV